MSLVSDLNVAEEIVSNNDSLMWQGWDIIQLKENPQAFMKRNAMYKNGKWFSIKEFALSENGWDLPYSMIGNSNDLQVGSSR